MPMADAQTSTLGGAANPAKRADSSCVVCTRLWRNCALTALQSSARRRCSDPLNAPPPLSPLEPLVPARQPLGPSATLLAPAVAAPSALPRVPRAPVGYRAPYRSSRYYLLPISFTSDFLLLSTLAIMRSDSQRKQLREKTQMPYSYYTFHGGYFRAGICSQATPDIRLKVAAYFIPQWR